MVTKPISTMTKTERDKREGVYRLGPTTWYWLWNEQCKPRFGFRIPIPWTERDYAFNFYFRYRPKACRLRTDNGPFVIDWPWFRYIGWLRYEGNTAIKVSRQEMREAYPMDAHLF